jgi:acetolactate synthase-1/2/3 large subunit
VEQAAELLANSRLPVIHAGSGVVHAGAFTELEELAKALQAPVTTSWGARGVMAETSDLTVPMFHVDLNNRIRNEADTVLVLGSRLGETDWWGKAPYWRRPGEQKMIQVDIDDDILGCNKPAELVVLADVRTFLGQLLAALPVRGPKDSLEEREAFLARIREEKEKHNRELEKAFQEDIDPMNSAHVPNVCRETFEDDAIVVLDGGNTAVWGNFYHQVRVPNTVLSTWKFGMLGAGVAQAMGAAAAFPERQVCCIIGDGAMGFHAQEVETAVRNGFKPVFLVLCDRQWGMVKMSQEFALSQTLPSYGPEDIVNADFSEIRFDRLAESMGAHGERVSRSADLAPAIQRSLDSGRCAVIHVDVNPVKHMWAPGLMQFKEMHLEPAGE